jgi:hypothetical protein
MTNRALGSEVKIPWDEYQLSPARHLWVLHLFAYCALLNPLSDDVSMFVKYSSNFKTSLGDAVLLTACPLSA